MSTEYILLHTLMYVEVGVRTSMRERRRCVHVVERVSVGCMYVCGSGTYVCLRMCVWSEYAQSVSIWSGPEWDLGSVCKSGVCVCVCLHV